MKQLHFEIMIKATPERVWQTIVDDKNYREWASVFQETSYFEGGWDKGDSIHFVGINDKGNKEGMISEIAESNRYSFISIRHLGFIMDGVEDTESPEIKAWAPSYENYTFSPMGENTKFDVDMDVQDEYAQMFEDLWPKALIKIKEISEKN